MNRDEVFALWAPAESLWSQWVAPVLFAQTYWDNRIPSELVAPSPLPWLSFDVKNAAIILDLPGPESVDMGFSIAGLGYRPVPLFNASPAPEEIIGIGTISPSIPSAVINMGPIVDAISRVTTSLRQLQVPADAPPVFLLDSSRLIASKPVEEGMYDNRWMVFPQDFPSVNFLKAHNIAQVLLLQKDRLEPRDDLAHVLLRWQEGGIPVLSKKLYESAPPFQINVQRPSRYKSALYRVLAQLGLRRSSAGGFGSFIPESSGHG